MSVCINTTCTGDCVPLSVTQGERVEWSKSYNDYPATDYSLVYRFRGPGHGINVTATADGDDFDAVLTAAATLLLDPGTWSWQAWITETADTTNTFPVDSGEMIVAKGFAASDIAEVDMRSPAQIALDTIDAALLSFATSDVTEYEIETPVGRRRIKRSDKANLMSMRKYYATMVSLERTKKRIQNGGKLMRSIGINVSER